MRLFQRLLRIAEGRPYKLTTRQVEENFIPQKSTTFMDLLKDKGTFWIMPFVIVGLYYQRYQNDVAQIELTRYKVKLFPKKPTVFKWRIGP